MIYQITYVLASPTPRHHICLFLTLNSAQRARLSIPDWEINPATRPNWAQGMKSMIYFTRTAMEVPIALFNMFLCTFPPHYGCQIPMGFCTSVGPYAIIRSVVRFAFICHFVSPFIRSYTPPFLHAPTYRHFFISPALPPRICIRTPSLSMPPQALCRHPGSLICLNKPRSLSVLCKGPLYWRTNPQGQFAIPTALRHVIMRAKLPQPWVSMLVCM